MQKQPLFILCLCFILGIFSQEVFVFTPVQIGTAAMFSALLLGLFFSPNFYLHRLRYISLYFLFFTLGAFTHFLSMQNPVLPHISGKQSVIFGLESKLNSGEKNRKYAVKMWQKEQHFSAVLSIPREQPPLDFKHFYKAEVYIHRVERAYQDYQFDYGKYLGRKGIFFQAYLPGSFAAGAKGTLTLSEEIKQKRLDLLQKLDKTTLSPRVREFTKGIILADRTEMDKEMLQDFSRSGLVHILAISGSHIAILFWIILQILQPVFAGKNNRIKILLALLLIWSFAVFINYGNSVVRSCIMISCYYIFVLLQRKTDLLHSMALAAFVILLVNSNELFDLGFQLSFLAVLGIFWLNQPLLNCLPKPKNTVQKVLVNIVSVSLSAQIITLPLVLFYFHQYSFISILANFIVIPFAELLILGALITTVLTELSLTLPYFLPVYDGFVTHTLRLIHYFAEIDTVYVRLVPMTLLEVVCALLLVYTLRSALQKPGVKSLSPLLFFALIFGGLRLLLNYRANQLDEVLEHRFFNSRLISVKKGEDIQFIYPHIKDSVKIPQYVIEPYITSRRVKRYTVRRLKEREQLQINGRQYQFEQQKR